MSVGNLEIWGSGSMYEPKKRVMLQELDIGQTPGSATEGQFDRVQQCKNLGKWDNGQTQRNWIIQTSWTMDEYL